MAIKDFEINGIGTIRVHKRRGSKSMRIKLSRDGNITVGIPSWVPYKMAIDYAKKQTDWIIKNRPTKKNILNGQRIGRLHIINFVEKDVESTSVKFNGSTVNITYPKNLDADHEIVQKVAERGARSALKKQTHLLEKEIHKYATRHGYEFKSLSYKFMKSKWGSCSNSKHITLNYRLLDIPSRLVEYVMIHELVHLNHLNHSQSFWNELCGLLPDYKQRKKELRDYLLEW